MKILVCGGSWETPVGTVWRLLDQVGNAFSMTRIIVPMHHGLDRAVWIYGETHGIETTLAPVVNKNRTNLAHDSEVSVMSIAKRLWKMKPEVLLCCSSKGPWMRPFANLAEDNELPIYIHNEETGIAVWQDSQEAEHDR